MTTTDTVKDWTIGGAEGEPILGNTHLPSATPRGVVLIAHGFKGYKDYGMFPRIAETMAEQGYLAHRFNFSHSGMSNSIETFERADLFERDTWNKQVHDYRCVIAALADGTLAGGDLPFVMFGHSRGGATALLTAGRHVGDVSLPPVAGIVVAATPSRLSNLTAAQEQALLTEGFLVSPSSRTGQALRIGRAFLQEQRDDPDGHNLLTQVGRITAPVLLVHGDADPTVPSICAQQLADAIGASARVAIVPGGDHVFNTTNPLLPDAKASPQLAQLLDGLTLFCEGVCR